MPLGVGSRLFTRLTTGVKDRAADMEEGMRTMLAALKRAAEAQGTVRTSAPSDI